MVAPGGPTAARWPFSMSSTASLDMVTHANPHLDEPPQCGGRQAQQRPREKAAASLERNRRPTIWNYVNLRNPQSRRHGAAACGGPAGPSWRESGRRHHAPAAPAHRAAAGVPRQRARSAVVSARWPRLAARTAPLVQQPRSHASPGTATAVNVPPRRCLHKRRHPPPPPLARCN